MANFLSRLVSKASAGSAGGAVLAPRLDVRHQSPDTVNAEVDVERAVDEIEIGTIAAVLQTDDLHEHELEVVEQAAHRRIVGRRRIHEQTRTGEQIAGARRKLRAGSA